MTLHICNKSPAESSALQSCLKITRTDSTNAVLLIEDAVYATLPALAQSLGLETTSTNAQLYVLRDDLTARGLEPTAALSVTPIDYAEFVQLCVTHKNSHSWY